MTRRQLLGSALAASALRAQPAAGIRYREYARCLPDYLAALAADAYTRRNARIAGLKTPAAIHDYQAWARRTFTQLAGPLPERTPLNVRTTGGFERDRYRVEKLVYESRPGLFVTANLYLPKAGTRPIPACFFRWATAPTARATRSTSAAARDWCNSATSCWRSTPSARANASPACAPLPTNTPFPGRQMLLVGETATGAMLWDAMRSLDVLAAHPQVDPKRLASTGQSGGATLTMILAAVDDRLAAAAVSSGNTENFAPAPFLAPGSSDDAEQDLVGSGPLAFDRWDLLWPIAPKPLLIAASAHDFFGTYSPSYERSGREEFAKLARAYRALGAADRLGYFESPLPHGLSYPMRMAIYHWFERFLKRERSPGGGGAAHSSGDR